MIRLALIWLSFLFWILLLSQALNGLKFWKLMDVKSAQQYYDSLSDKNLAFEMDYVVYRNYAEQIADSKINTKNIITKVDYANLKSWIKENKKWLNTESIKTNIDIKTDQKRQWTKNNLFWKKLKKKDSNNVKKKFPFFKK